MSPQVDAAWIAGASGFLGVLVGVTGTVVVAVRGFRSTQRATLETITAGAANVRAQIEADRQARRSDRLHDAYNELGIYLSRQADWARSAHPFIGPVPVPEPPKREDLYRVETLVTLYGSLEVRRLLDEWGKQARKVELADRTITFFEKSQNPSIAFAEQVRDEQLALPGYKDAMIAADEALRAQMNLELANS